MFHGNYITGSVFNINLALAKNEVKSPEVDPKSKERLLILESDSSQESTTRYAETHSFAAFTRGEILSALEDKIRIPKWPCNILYISNDNIKWFLIPSNTEQSLCSPMTFNQSAKSPQSFPLNLSNLNHVESAGHIT